MLCKSKPAPFTSSAVPLKAGNDFFDVFQTTFEAVEGSPVDSEAYNSFLRSDGFSGEMAAMSRDWLRRMRLEIFDHDSKYHQLVAEVARQTAAGVDPQDQTYLKNKFFADEKKQQRQTLAIDHQEGNVSDVEAVQPSCFSCACSLP